MAQQQGRWKQCSVSEQVLRTGLCYVSLDLLELLPSYMKYIEFFMWRNSLVMLPPMPYHNRFMDRMKRDYDNICRASLRFSGCSRNLSVKQVSPRMMPIASDVHLPPDMKPIAEKEIVLAYKKYWELQQKRFVSPLLSAPSRQYEPHACLSSPISGIGVCLQTPI